MNHDGLWIGVGVLAVLVVTAAVLTIAGMLYRNRRWPTPEKAPPHITGIDPYGRG